MGSELGQSAGVSRNRSTDAASGGQGSGRAAARRGRLHVETHRDPVSVRARSPYDPASPARLLPHRLPRGDPSGRGDRRACRNAALSGSRASRWARRQSCLSQLTDGAILGRARHARCHDDDACAGVALSRPADQCHLCHLHPLPRRHRLGGDGRRRGGAACVRPRPPRLSVGFLRGRFCRFILTRGAVSGKSGNRRQTHFRQLCLAGGAGESDCRGRCAGR